MRYISFPLIVCFVIQFAAAQSTTQTLQTADGQPVVVEGWGVAGKDGDTAAARQAAINQALALAVEQRLGANVEASRQVVNHVLVADRIVKSVKGDVSRYEVVEERAREGAYWVKLRVTLRADEIRKLDQVRIGLAVKQSPWQWDSKPIADALAERLTGEGISLTVVPADASDPSDVNCDLLIAVQAKQVARKPMGELQLAGVEMNASMLRPGGVVVQVLRTKAEGERKTSMDESAAPALEAASTEMAAKLVQALAERGKYVTRRIVVGGLPDRYDVDRIEKALKETNGVGLIRLAGHSGSSAMWIAEVEPETARRLADRLQHIQGVDLNVTEEHDGWLVARKPAGSGGI